MNIILVEDEEKQQKVLAQYLHQFLSEKNIQYQNQYFYDGESFLKNYHDGMADLIFMDIELGKDKLNGMSVSKKLREIDDEVVLIFVTNMANFAIEGYSVNALDFIVKPVLYDPFRMKMERALKVLSTKLDLKNVLIQVENSSKQIIASDVMYVEVNNHDLFYHTSNGEEYKVRASLKSAMKTLESLPFCQCNSCYLVNLRYVERIERDEVVLLNNEKLKMPRTRKKEFLEQLGLYLSGAKK